jgi:uncharacterized protein (TIGR03435 family)
MRTFSDSRGTVTQGGSTTLAAIAGALDGAAGRSVIDRTGLSGTFDVDLRYARSNAPAAAGDDNPLPTVFTALQEQLGLKLEPSKGPFEVVVIDKVARPTPD